MGGLSVTCYSVLIDETCLRQPLRTCEAFTGKMFSVIQKFIHMSQEMAPTFSVVSPLSRAAILGPYMLLSIVRTSA